MHNYPAESLNIQARLHSFGVKPNHLMLIGSFVVAYGLFETTLERVNEPHERQDTVSPLR
ncbi:hypothetical protein EAH72_34830 [Pseudomonas caspiana]|nr:hypothetical protein EAH72_34830 [Pseudomonas caspiana]